MLTTHIAGPRPNFTIITTNIPETLLSLLHTKRTASFLMLRRPASAGSESSYFIEHVHTRRRVLQSMYMLTEVEIPRDEWDFHGGLYWPDNLMTFPGPWKNPLDFSFPRLMLLDLDVQDAVYWLMPILQVIKLYAPFRCVILRGCVDYDTHAVSFPFDKFDSFLDRWPAAKVLIAWADSDEDYFIGVWRTRLPKLESAGRIGVLYSGGEHAILPPMDSDHEELGQELVDETGRLYVDVYTPGCINEWSWRYEPDQDPLRSIYDHDFI